MKLRCKTELVEFKESTNELKERVRSLVSRLNKHKKGTLYFGLKNKGDVCGQQVGDYTLREISQAISVNVEPSIIPIISVLDGPKAGLEAIKVSENFITVTIPFAFKPAWALAAEASTAKHILTETQNRILDLLAQQSEISGAELSGKLNVSVSAIRKNIAFLRDNDFIERIGTNRKGYWKIKER